MPAIQIRLITPITKPAIPTGSVYSPARIQEF